MPDINVQRPPGGSQFVMSQQLSPPPPVIYPATISSFLNPLKEFANGIQGVALGMLPLNLIQVGINCQTLYSQPVPKKINASLEIVTRLKEIGQGVSIFIKYLINLQVISNSAFLWSAPFGLAMSILSIASIARKAKICHEAKGLIKDFDAILSTSNQKGMTRQAAYYQTVAWIEQKQKEDPEFLPEMFNAKEDQFIETLNLRTRMIDKKLASSDPDSQAEGQSLLDITVHALRGRIKKNITNSVLSMIASAISVIGAILIFCCPILPVGWGMVGAGALIDSGRLLHHKISEYQFAKATGLRRTALEWISC